MIIGGSEQYPGAALLSTKAEFSPKSAQEVNVNGTLKLLNFSTSTKHETRQLNGASYFCD